MINNNVPAKETQSRLLALKIKTWSRDSHGLYDYECSQTKDNTYVTKKDHVLVRKRNEVRIEGPDYKEEQEEENLGKIYSDALGRYFFYNPVEYLLNPNEENINNLQNKLWYIIKSEDNNPNNSSQSPQIINENDFAEVNLNDIIKLGRVKYAVTEMKINNVKTSIDQASHENQVFNLIPEFPKQNNVNMEVLCKICLTNTEEEGNPLVNLCKCSGSMELIHYYCVKMWMNTKLTNKENEKKTVLSYNMKSFNCEICRTPYPLRFRYNSNYFEIIECQRPQNSNYIVLESLNQLKDNSNYKSIHVILLNEGERIIMGRGHDSDVRINDISVSRTHSCLTLNNQKKVILKDLRSKFGTLILIQREKEISDKKLSIQIGRSYFEASINSKQKENSSQQIKLNTSGNNINKKPIFQVVKKDKDEMDIDS